MDDRLLEVGHFGVRAGPDGVPRANAFPDGAAFDIGAVALGVKPHSLTSAEYLDGSRAHPPDGCDPRLHRHAVRRAARAGLAYLRLEDLRDALKQTHPINPGTCVLFPTARFQTAVALAVMQAFVGVRMVAPRHEEYVVGRLLGYPDEDIFARYAWRTLGLGDPPDRVAYLAGRDRLRPRFRALVRAADGELAASLRSKPFQRIVALCRPLVRPVKA